MCETVTRIDESNLSKKEKRKHKKDKDYYNVVSSADAPTKLTLKLSKTKEKEEKRGQYSEVWLQLNFFLRVLGVPKHPDFHVELLNM